MKVFIHHIYEYEKGIRKLILHTLNNKYKSRVQSILKKRNIHFVIRDINKEMFNVFFGDPACIAVMNRIGDKPLYDFSPEEDFILGVLLGYDNIQQCDRYIKRSNKKEKDHEENINNLRINYGDNGIDCSNYC